MAHLIDKDALVAEIERRIGEIDKYYCDINCVYQRIEECKGFLSFLDALEVKEVDSLQEEPASEDLEEASKNYALNNTPWDDCKDEIQESFKAGAQWQKAKDESTTEDLGEYINELSKQFPEVSFAKLSRIAVRVSRWQRNQDVKNKLPKVINRTDLDEYAYQCAYDMSNDWAKEDPTWHDVEMACKLGAKWQKEKDSIVSEDLEEETDNYIKINGYDGLDSREEVKYIANHFAKWQKEQFEKNRLAACDRQTEEEAEREQDFVMGIIENEHRKPTFDDAIKYGMNLQKEQMMAKAIDGKVLINGMGNPILHLWDKGRHLIDKKVKVIVIKED